MSAPTQQDVPQETVVSSTITIGDRFRAAAARNRERTSAIASPLAGFLKYLTLIIAVLAATCILLARKHPKEWHRFRGRWSCSDRSDRNWPCSSPSECLPVHLLCPWENPGGLRGGYLALNSGATGQVPICKAFSGKARP